MPEQFFFKQGANATLFRGFPRLIGGGIILFGLLIIISWHAQWRSILQMLPNSAPTQYNTALLFILSGAGLFLLTTSHFKRIVWFGAVVASISSMTLLQYLTGRDFGIDQIFFKPFLESATAYPGRMSPLAAICFIFIGAGILLAGASQRWPHRLTGAGLLSCVVAVIATVALFGYAFGIDAAYGWGAHSRMTVNTAALFLLLSLGLLIWTCQTAHHESINFLRWLPVTGSVTLMIMVAFISVMNMAELKNATFWRKHTFEVILSVQSFEENLIDAQRGVRGYMTMGDTNALASFRASASDEPRRFHELFTLTRDNPVQQKHLKELSDAMSDVFSYDNRIITMCKEQGFAAALDTDTNGVSRAVFGNARGILKNLSQEEQGLLGKRDAAEQSDYHNAERLLIFGSVLAAALLVMANSMASRELHHRRRVELKLREVTTLQNAVFDSAEYAIIALEPNGIVRTFNPAAERMLGYSAAEIIGKVTPMLWRDPAEVVTQAEKISCELGRTVRPGIDILTAKTVREKADEYEVTYIRKDGSRFPVFVSLTTLADETGTVTGFLGIIADITRRKKDEAALRESEERFRSAFDDAPIGMALVSPTGRWLKVNRALCEMIGYSAPELLATDFQNITHSEDLETDLEFLRQMLAGEIPSYQMEKRYFHKGGSIVFVMLSVSLVCDAARQPLYLVAQIENISERKKQEVEREAMFAELQLVLAQVKTLSGMIPICGWCKSVRSDTGYWQTVEQYVKAHTDATFSHGVCPDCAEKFKASIPKIHAAPAA